MDESDQKPTQEESKEEETTDTTKEETPAAADDGESDDLLKTELESLEKTVVEELNSDKAKEAIDKTKEAIENTKTAIESFALGFAESAKGLASKVETWSSVLHNKEKPKGSEEGDNLLPTSDKHVEDSSETAADTDNANNHEQTPTTTDKQTSWMNCCGLLEVLARPSDK